MITPEDLRRLPLFADLDAAQLHELALNAADVRLGAGEWLVQEGDTPAFFVLLEGELEVTKTLGGSERVLTTYRPGATFGEVPLLLGSDAVANVRAVTPARVLRLEALDFHELLARSDRAASLVLRNMAQRVTRLEQLAVETPPAVTLLVGRQADLECFGLREFLSRNQVLFRWIDPEDPTLAQLVPPGVESGKLPAVVLPDGEVLQRPSIRQVARRVGLEVTPRADGYDVVILGGGPAGLAAAVYGASEGLRTLLVEKQAPGGQAGTSSRIENYLGFPNGLSGDELSARALRQARRFGAEVVTTRRATALHPDGDRHTVTLDGGVRVRARTVVLATGVEWRKLPVPGAGELTGRGIWYGASRTEAPSVRGKDVYLVGGGNSAGQAAMFFSSYARRVTLLIRADSVEKGMSQYLIEQLRGKANVRLCVNREVVAVRGGNQLTGITVRDRVTGRTEEVATDSLFVFIGADARTDWLPRAILRDERGYVLTGLAVPRPAWPLARDPLLLETSVPGIFAAGDVRHGSIKRVASAVGEGSMAIALIHEYLALSPPSPHPAAATGD